LGTIAPMSLGDGVNNRRSGAAVLGLAALALGALAGLGCRANPEQCQAAAAHLGSLAEAEGRSLPGMVADLDGNCRQLEPTQKLLRCIMAAETLAAAEDC